MTTFCIVMKEPHGNIWNNSKPHNNYPKIKGTWFKLNSGIQQSKGRCKIWFPVWHVKMKYNHPTNFPTIPGTEQCLLGYWVIKMHCQMNECHAQNGQTQWWHKNDINFLWPELSGDNSTALLATISNRLRKYKVIQ